MGENEAALRSQVEQRHQFPAIESTKSIKTAIHKTNLPMMAVDVSDAMPQLQ